MQLIDAIIVQKSHHQNSRSTAWLAVLLLISQWIKIEAAVFVSIGQNFTGNTFGDISQALPPDSNGAIGPSHFVEFINGVVSVYNKADGQSVLALSDVDFW